MNFESWFDAYQPVANPNGRAFGFDDTNYMFETCGPDLAEVERVRRVDEALIWTTIGGYKPLFNFQRMLFEVISDRLRTAPALEAAATAAVEQPAVMPSFPEFSEIVVKPPDRLESPTIQRQGLPYDVFPLELRAIKRDYVERESRNRSLGLAGELLVVELERWQLKKAGQDRLAAKVVHISKELGDGPGFDVLSFDPDGLERYIEVKTTSFGRDTPFFVTQRELEISVRESSKFALYRLFDFRRQPRLFELPGKIADHCRLNPQTFRASVC